MKRASSLQAPGPDRSARALLNRTAPVPRNSHRLLRPVKAHMCDLCEETSISCLRHRRDGSHDGNGCVRSRHRLIHQESSVRSIDACQLACVGEGFTASSMRVGAGACCFQGRRGLGPVLQGALQSADWFADRGCQALVSRLINRYLAPRRAPGVSIASASGVAAFEAIGSRSGGISVDSQFSRE